LTQECIGYQDDPLSFGEGGIGQILVSLAVQGFVYMVVLVVNDMRILHVLWYKLTCVGVSDAYRLDR